ncbi:Sec-independent protein translocase subunit TatA [Streptomyces sp. NBC_00536]|uniref:Sec-independent protein translocase subunit TatA n=1 Tax=Streptomyces sp. NBC_00536 TaxID=2975769 RepID=UPI002E803208|nr:Sec-independent protein translocase subunit TatA [Streptomyces sp. NBC_00536]WUC79809.1 Sec-independent protein translocase subunit TatA [Streptomyces sp. NBC_00536]
MLRNAMEPWHLVVLLVVCLLVFGSKKLPDMARSLGKSARILKSEAKAMRAEDQSTPSTPSTPGEVAPH